MYTEIILHLRKCPNPLVRITDLYCSNYLFKVKIRRKCKRFGRQNYAVVVIDLSLATTIVL